MIAPAARWGDVRAQAALRVLSGDPPQEVARALDVDPTLVERWTAAFVAAGTAGVAGLRDATPDVARLLETVASRLRNPVTAARGWASMLADERLTAEQQAEARSALCRRLDELITVFDDLHDAAAVILGREPIRPVPVDLMAIVRDTWPGPPEAIDFGRLDPAGIVVKADHDLLSRAFRVFFRAVVELADGARSRVRLTCSDQWVTVTVSLATPVDPSRALAMLEPLSGPLLDAWQPGFALFLVRSLVVAQGGHLGMNGTGEAGEAWVRLPRMSPAAGPERR